MNYREKMREYLKEPSINGSAIGYGKWCVLNHEQRTLIRRLLDEMDKADDFNKSLHLKNQKYKEVINKAIKYIEENKQHEYRNGNFNEYYLELNEKEMAELLDILKEVEHGED